MGQQGLRCSELWEWIHVSINSVRSITVWSSLIVRDVHGMEGNIYYNNYIDAGVLHTPEEFTGCGLYVIIGMPYMYYNFCNHMVCTIIAIVVQWSLWVWAAQSLFHYWYHSQYTYVSRYVVYFLLSSPISIPIVLTLGLIMEPVPHNIIICGKEQSWSTTNFIQLTLSITVGITAGSCLLVITICICL